MVFYESSTFESDVTLLPIALASLQRSLAGIIHQGDVRATVTICYVAGGKTIMRNCRLAEHLQSVVSQTDNYSGTRVSYWGRFA